MAALGFLSLSYHEAHAPLAVCVFVLVFLALARHLPAGWPSRIAGAFWWVAAISLAIVVAIFVTGQLRFALYPQLADQGDAYEFGDPMSFGLAAAPAPEPIMAEAEEYDEDDGIAAGAPMESVEEAEPPMGQSTPVDPADDSSVMSRSSARPSPHARAASTEGS